MPELRANKEKPNFDNNPKLVEAIAEMRKDFKPETQNKVINAALRCTFLVPAVVEQSTELVADANNKVDFQNKSKAKFILINNTKTNGTFFPVFAMKFGDIASLTETTPNVKGFVINPFNQNLPFTQEMLVSIKNTLIKAKAAKEAEAKGESAEAGSNITVSTNDAPEA